MLFMFVDDVVAIRNRGYVSWMPMEFLCSSYLLNSELV